MLRGLIAALVLACACGSAHAQQQLTKGVKAILQTAATVCVEWVSGRADFSKTPPPGFRAASAMERIGFNIGMGVYGRQVTSVWLTHPGEPIERAVIEIDGGCMAYSVLDLSPVDIDVMKSSFETMMRRLDPDAPDLEFDWSSEEDGFRTVFYLLDENPDMMVGIGQGWRNGRAARGTTYVVVRKW